MVRWAGDTIALEDIERRVDEAAFEPDRWMDVAGDITVLIPGTKVVLQAVNEEPPFHCTLVNHGWEQFAVDSYLQHFIGLNPWVESWRVAGVGIPVRSDHTLPRSELVRTEFYNDWLKVIHEADGATGIKIAHGNGRLAIVAVHYDHKRSDDLHPTVSGILRRLGPRMARSLEANRLLARREATTQMRPMIDRFRDAAIAVDHKGRLVAANALAENMLDGNSILRIGTGDTLHFVDAVAEHAFRQHLNETLGPMAGIIPDVDDIKINHGSTTYQVSLLAVGTGLNRRKRGSFLPFHYDETLCLVVIRASRALVAVQECSLQGIERYRLTRSEARVVSALCEGGSLREIASRLDIAYDTVRTHLKRIYQKTGSRSQRDLVHLFVTMT